MMDAVGLTKNHLIYYVQTGSNKYGQRHFFGMIDNLCFDPAMKNPWEHGNLKRSVYTTTLYPLMPIPYGDYR